MGVLVCYGGLHGVHAKQEALALASGSRWCPGLVGLLLKCEGLCALCGLCVTEVGGGSCPGVQDPVVLVPCCLWGEVHVCALAGCVWAGSVGGCALAWMCELLP